MRYGKIKLTNHAYKNLHVKMKAHKTQVIKAFASFKMKSLIISNHDI